MFDVMLPIAGVWINLAAVGCVGLLIGFVSGLFGVGGGFLMTPILIFLGLPPSISIATGSAQLVASAAFSTTVAARQRMIDPKLSLYSVGGALTGTTIGIAIFNLLSRMGSLDLVIGVSYVVLLGTVGGLMLKESVAAIRHKHVLHDEVPSENYIQHRISQFTFKAHFQRIDLSISLVPLIGISVVIGTIGTILGVGGGFMFVPALIYFFRLPTRAAVAASQVQILITMVAATLLHAIFNHAIDVVLAMPLIVGGVFGSYLGTLAGRVVNGAKFRLALAVLILMVAIRFLIGLILAITQTRQAAEPIHVSLAALPAWESWIAVQASGNSMVYGLSTAFIALLFGYFGARLFGRV